MLNNIFLLFIFPFMSGVFGWLMSNVLTEPNKIFYPLFNLLVNKWKLGDTHWLTMPTVACSYCIAGQSALWSYLALCYHYDTFSYDWMLHVWVIVAAIFSVEIINKRYL